MPYTMEQFRKDYLKAHIRELPPEDRLEGLDPEERLKGLNPDERLKGLDPEERLKGLDPRVIEAYLERLKSAKLQ